MSFTVTCLPRVIYHYQDRNLFWREDILMCKNQEVFAWRFVLCQKIHGLCDSFKEVCSLPGWILTPLDPSPY